jgi:hypothetical protein
MRPTVLEVFLRNEDYESFRDELIDLNGNFELEPEDMLELGKELIRRYGDTGRADARPAYRVTRLCLLEKILADRPTAPKEALREIFSLPRSLPESLDRLSRASTLAEIRRLHRGIEENTARLQLAIDRLPKGMIRERFSGGISSFLNVLYLFECEIDRRTKAGGHAG